MSRLGRTSPQTTVPSYLSAYLTDVVFSSILPYTDPHPQRLLSSTQYLFVDSR